MIGGGYISDTQRNAHFTSVKLIKETKQQKVIPSSLANTWTRCIGGTAISSGGIPQSSRTSLDEGSGYWFQEKLARQPKSQASNARSLPLPLCCEYFPGLWGATSQLKFVKSRGEMWNHTVKSYISVRDFCWFLDGRFSLLGPLTSNLERFVSMRRCQ